MIPEENFKEIEELIQEDQELLAGVKKALESIEVAKSLGELGEVRIDGLGRKGLVKRVFDAIKKVEDKDRSKWGKAGNLLKQTAEEMLALKEAELEVGEREKEYRDEAVDVTLPGRAPIRGKRHILSQVTNEITDIFISLGYRVVEGPEVEEYYYNFEALNTPSYHPSTSIQDTFYVKGSEGTDERPGEILLRTETSPVQVRVMSSEKPPVYVISPGKVYRRDAVDATHSAMFHQVEGFAVDKGIHMGHLKGTLEVFAKRMFGERRKVRFRPHFFPFTEPSAEVDVSCVVCDGEGCSICKGSGWLEILGAGMVDPNVFENVGYDPEEVSGFAFGMGIERIAMMKYGVENIRLFFDNDIRFLSQF